MPNTKICCTCKQSKELSNFHFKNKKKNIYASKCKQCTSEYDKQYRLENLEKRRKQKAKYRSENKEKIAQRNKEHYRNNKDKYREYYERTQQRYLDYSIYCITIKGTRKVYIGETKRFKTRLYAHRSELKLNKHHNSILQEHYNKEGIDGLEFEVLENLGVTKTKLELLKKEIYWIEYYLERGYEVINNVLSI